MQLLNNREVPASSPGFLYPGGAAAGPLSSWQALFALLSREQRPGYLLGEIVLAVFLLHGLGLLWLLAISRPIAQAKPLMMEVSLVAAPQQQPQPQAAPPAPPKPPEPPEPLKKKPKKKPVVKKKPIVKKPVAKDAVALPKPQATDSAPVEAPPSPPAPPSSAKKAASPAQTFTEANFQANYGFNPKPEYPRLARNRGWEGKVLLKVQVSAGGLSDSVEVHHSSGHDILDESAVTAVEKWKFIPAMRDSTPVATSVIVPIIFTLNN